jgi:hypothetical protein
MDKQHLIEWDVELWTYVLYYDNKKYVLNVSDIRKAYEKFELIQSGVRQIETL